MQKYSDRPAPSMLSVFAGSACVGFLMHRGRLGVELFDRDERTLGVFPTQREAVAALLEAQP